MKIPSLQYLYQHASKACLRFPLTMLSALVAVSCSIYLIELNDAIVNKLPFINLILTSSIGIPLYFCVRIFSEKLHLSLKPMLALQVLATTLLVLVYYSLPHAESTHNTSLPYIKYGIYNAICHLLVSFIPYLFNRELNGFWNYNKLLFIRFLTSILYSGFIYVGLILALSALHLLFDIKIHSELYGDLWVLCALLFNTWFFIAGIPENFDALDTNYEYPKGLKIFAQYILLPLLALYLIILYAYGSKIIFLWDWPKGIVSYLIICVSVLGIFAFLLLYPYGNEKGNAWIKKAYKGYYLLLLPLLVLLFIAIYLRLMDYGITINRYVIIALGVWLSIVGVYTMIGKSNIKFIPTSLAIIMLFTSFGPWGMFSVSEKNQVARLEKILVEAQLLKQQKINRESIYTLDKWHNLISKNSFSNESVLNDSLHNEVKSILEYLDHHHGFASIQPWFSQDVHGLITELEKYPENKYRYNEAEIYMNALGLNYEDKDVDEKTFGFTIHEDAENAKYVKSFDYMISFNHYLYHGRTQEEASLIKTFKIDSIKYELELQNDSTITLVNNQKTIASINIHNFIESLINKYGDTKNYKVPVHELEYKNNNSTFKIVFTSIQLEHKNNKNNITEISGDLLLKIEK
jgi:hypothetical protein